MKHFLSISLFTLLLFGCGEPSQPVAKPTKKQTGKETYTMYCAMCHGMSGDGVGTVTLDRPARSFIDGGFSFGNTVEAISKTTRSGIPGTPMPPFADVLDDEQINKVATYVRSLAPTVQEVDIEDTEMVVRNRPIVARGTLPPVQDGLQLHPRGVVVGNPDGFSYEYRADDVRLLAIRQGRFVSRADWGARGGSPLTMLGKIIVLVVGGNPQPMFTTLNGEPLHAQLVATNTLGTYGTISYDLLDKNGEKYATVEELCKSTTLTRALIEQVLTINTVKPFQIQLPTDTVMDESTTVPIGTTTRTIIHATKGSE